MTPTDCQWYVLKSTGARENGERGSDEGLAGEKGNTAEEDRS